MRRRFARARRVALECPGGVLHPVLAEGRRLRLVGLAMLGATEIEPVLFERCPSVHTFGMKAEIDVAWLDLSGEKAAVLGVEPTVRPRRFVHVPCRSLSTFPPRIRMRARRVAALELPAGMASDLGLTQGARINVKRAVD